MKGTPGEHRTVRLSPAHWRVLELRATGLTMAAVAHEMGVSEGVAKEYSGMAMARLGATTLIEALIALDWIKVGKRGDTVVVRTDR